jgi:hypothetical protein
LSYTFDCECLSAVLRAETSEAADARIQEIRNLAYIKIFIDLSSGSPDTLLTTVTVNPSPTLQLAKATAGKCTFVSKLVPLPIPIVLARIAMAFNRQSLRRITHCKQMSGA